MLREWFDAWAENVMVLVEAAAVALIVIGAAEAMWNTVRRPRPNTVAHKKYVWVLFARWLLLALEFQLAADIIGTAISPTWDEIGRVAAIAVIRTFLGVFLERDMESAVEYERVLSGKADRPRPVLEAGSSNVGGRAQRSTGTP